MVSSIETAAGRTAAAVGNKLFGAVRRRLEVQRVRDKTRALAPSKVADSFLAELTSNEIHALSSYLNSPDFEEVAVQLALWRLLRDQVFEEIHPTLRDEIRHGLRHAIPGLAPHLLTTGADVVFDALLVAMLDETRGVSQGDVDPVTVAAAGHLAVAAVNNTRLLERVESLVEFHSFGERLRAQVAKLHGEMRMPHLGISRSVPYSQLYVEPSLPNLRQITLPGHRSVLLGDPGAGKSTLAAKIAWEIASGPDERVPFLLVLREFTNGFREGGQGLISYLGARSVDPYNLAPPPDAVEYLLSNGRAVILLDGVDELVDAEVRRRFAQLVEGFVLLYPSVPVVVTARKIGYNDAPLDRRLFTTQVIPEFELLQVSEYVYKWFSLDAATSTDQRALLAAAFLRESQAIGELRANPLLLALLCAMYSSEHYLPVNLAQIYEKCAVMLFDQWDRMRGIRPDTPFQGRLRSAVGFLAWRQLNSANSGTALARRQVVHILTTYLEEKGFDQDDAQADAEEFVRFCTGRPWVLTDTGSGNEEPLYGFTHRTFLEYFAAEHLVRTHRAHAELWPAVEAQLAHGNGDMVAQIALQLYDQRHDEGASLLLREAVSSGESHAVAFAARSLIHLYPIPEITALIVDHVIRKTVVPLENIFRYKPTSLKDDTWDSRITPLYELLNDSLPNNRNIVRRAMRATLNELANDDSITTSAVLWHLREQLPGPEVERPEPWATILDGTGPLASIVQQFGPRVLYLRALAGYSIAERLLIAEKVALDPGPLLEARRPWLPREHWRGEMRSADLRSVLHITADEAIKILLMLPYVESEHVTLATPGKPPLLEQLIRVRVGSSRADLSSLGLTRPVQRFLEKWARGKISIIQ